MSKAFEALQLLRSIAAEQKAAASYETKDPIFPAVLRVAGGPPPRKTTAGQNSEKSRLDAKARSIVADVKAGRTITAERMEGFIADLTRGGRS